MPTQSALSINKGPITAVVNKSRRDGAIAYSEARKLFVHNDWESVQNFVDDRVEINPTSSSGTDPRFGSTLTFELKPEADAICEVDFRCALPSLYVPPPSGAMFMDLTPNAPAFADPSGQQTLVRGVPVAATGARAGLPIDPEFHIGVSNGNSIVHPFVQYPTSNTDRAGFFRYRIPGNPGAKTLLRSTYAIVRPGTCGVNSSGCVPDNYVNSRDYIGGSTTSIQYIMQPDWINANDAPLAVVGDNSVALAANPAIDSFLYNQPVAMGTANDYKNINTYVTRSYDLPTPIYADYIGYHMIEEVRVKQNSSPLQLFNGYDQFLMDQKFHNQETSDYYAEMAGAWTPNLSTGSPWSSVDLAKARAVRNITVPLDILYWVGRITSFLPIIAVHNNITIEIQLRRADACILFEKFNYDPFNGASSVSIGGNLLLVTPAKVALPQITIPIRRPVLVLHRSHVPDKSRTDIINQLDSPMGWLWKVNDFDRSREKNINSQNATSYDLTLTGTIKGAVTTLFFTKIHLADKYTPYETHWTNFLRVNDYQLKAGNDFIIPLTTHDYDQLRLNNLYNNSKYNRKNIYAHNFAKVPGDKFNGWGHMEFANLANPTLTLRYGEDRADYSTQLEVFGPTFRPHFFSTGSPIEGNSSHVLDCTALIHQVIQQKSGQIMKAFY